jgi:hypothetical protein
MIDSEGAIFEQACHEGNSYGLAGILAGARAEEKQSQEPVLCRLQATRVRKPLRESWATSRHLRSSGTSPWLRGYCPHGKEIGEMTQFSGALAKCDHPAADWLATPIAISLRGPSIP